MTRRHRLPIRCAAVVALALLALTPTGRGHPPEDSSAPHALVIEWALALQNSEPEDMEALLHPEFSSTAALFPRDRAGLLQMLRERVLEFERVLVKHAVFAVEADQIRVEPVTFYLAFFQQPRAFALRLARHRGEWRIIGIADSKAIPQALIATLPEQHRLYPVKVRIRDRDTGEPVFARVHVRDTAGEYWPPAGHMKNFPTGFNSAVGGDVIVDGERFAYVQPQFQLPLAPGSYVLEADKGMEYEPSEIRFEVAAESVPVLEVSMKRWIDMNERGWYSGDTHIHFLTPEAALLEMRAEEFNVANVLAAKWNELYTNVEHFTGRPSAVSDARHVVYVNEEARHPHLGHTVLLNLRDLVYPMAWGVGGVQASEGIWGGLDFPPMVSVAADARRQGGLVSWAHFPNPGAEIAVDFALGEIDAVDLVTWADPLSAGTSRDDSAVRAWYRLLDAGYRVPALGGTDKMFNAQIAGAVRTYVEVDGAFGYEAWIEGIRTGRTFATSGPMLTMTVSGRGPGATLDLAAPARVAVEVAVESRLPVDTIEIVMNGAVAAQARPSGGSRRHQWTVDVDVATGGWLAARAYSDLRLTYQRFGHFNPPLRHFAHTSPVYITVGGRGRVSQQALEELAGQVEQLIEWTRATARVADDAQREEMLALFREARRIYRDRRPAGLTSAR
jgi:hypothetical protein